MWSTSVPRIVIKNLSHCHNRCHPGNINICVRRLPSWNFTRLMVIFHYIVLLYSVNKPRHWLSYKLYFKLFKTGSIYFTFLSKCRWSLCRASVSPPRKTFELKPSVSNPGQNSMVDWHEENYNIIDLPKCKISAY